MLCFLTSPRLMCLCDTGEKMHNLSLRYGEAACQSGPARRVPLAACGQCPFSTGGQAARGARGVFHPIAAFFRTLEREGTRASYGPPDDGSGTKGRLDESR
jgi:hypothetical protein